MKNPKIHYYIAGIGNKEEYLKKLANELNVHLLEYREDIPELLMSADLFAFPSYREGLSVALMEAMAAGLPCVVSNIRGNVDLIENSKGGFLFDPRNEADAKLAIERLIIDSEKREKMKIVNLKNINK